MSRQNFNLLLVEDDAGDAEYLEDVLSDVEAISFNVVNVEQLATAFSVLNTGNHFDVILLDLSLPDSQGIDTFKQIHAAAAHIPIIVLTGLDDEEVAFQALHAGAQDFLNKTGLNGVSLARSIRYSIERYALLEEVEKLRENDMQRKNAFLSHVSHELRSPLAVIHQFVSLLLDGIGGEMNAEQQEYLKITMRNTEQLHAMINDLLEVTRADTAKLTVAPKRIASTSLIAKQAETSRLSAMLQEIKLHTELPDSLPAIYADPVRVQQILTNLVENAIKFTPSAGAIVVAAQVYEKNPKFLHIKVSDTGEGIADDDKQQIFDRLYQIDQTIDTGRTGLGLGLHICKELVELQGGRIWVESVVGEGSVFSFTLPIFSMAQLLTPVLTKEAFHNGATLITATLVPQKNEQDKGQFDHAIGIAQQLLERCVYPDCDLLLPQLIHDESHEAFFIVAAADHDGASVLCRRIESQLGQSSALQKAAIHVSLSSTELELPAVTDDCELDVQLEAIAKQIENIVDHCAVPHIKTKAMASDPASIAMAG